jgi:hypothetical protein
MRPAASLERRADDFDVSILSPVAHKKLRQLEGVTIQDEEARTGVPWWRIYKFEKGSLKLRPEEKRRLIAGLKTFPAYAAAMRQKHTSNRNGRG